MDGDGWGVHGGHTVGGRVGQQGSGPASVQQARFPRLLESPGFFFLNSRSWKVLENHFGPEKSWKLEFKVLEKIPLKITH